MIMPRKSDIRRIAADEAGALTAHLQRLGGADRRKRFGRPVGDAQIARYVAGIDWARAGVLAYLAHGGIRGSAQLAWPRLDWLDGAEVGLTVEAPWRNRGIGGELMRRAVTMARNLGLDELRIYTLADNEPAKRLARKAGFRLAQAGPEVEGRLPLPVADVASLIDEAVDNGATIVDTHFHPPRPGDLLRPPHDRAAGAGHR